MHQNPDPLGEAIYDYYHHGRADELQLISSVGEPDIFPVQHLFRDEAACPAIEITAMNRCRGSVLDVGAGAGVHSLILQQRGFDVTALEQSALAVSVMKSRGIRRVVEADFFNHEDARYDTLMMLMNGVGMVGRLKRLPQFFKQVKALLKPGGQLLVDSSDLIDYYTDEAGRINLASSRDYYGEVRYQMKYGALLATFDWLFVDPDTLQVFAIDANGKFELLYESADGSYLARISFNHEISNGKMS